MSSLDLRGPSADALAALSERLSPARGIVPTVTRLAARVTGGEADSDMARLGEDLYGVATLLRSEPGLRRVATDVSTDPEAKSRLFKQILDGKVSRPARDLVTDAVQRRWTRTRDLADALEHLAVVAIVDSAGDASDQLSDELFAVGQLIDEQPEVRTALSDPTRSNEDKTRLLRALLEGKTLPATQRLAELALTGSHRSFSVAIEEYQKVAADAHGQRVAEVHVAHELNSADIERLQAALSNQYGRTVHLNVVVDPEILGGMRVEIGDDVIDGTVSGRIDDARRRLAG